MIPHVPHIVVTYPLTSVEPASLKRKLQGYLLQYYSVISALPPSALQVARQATAELLRGTAKYSQCLKL